ncbi:MAG: hypothetical protein ACOY3P_00025, partial [Planctomycetota bacterium]
MSAASFCPRTLVQAVTVLLLGLMVLPAIVIAAEEPATGGEPAAATEAAAATETGSTDAGPAESPDSETARSEPAKAPLDTEQRRIADRFQHLEEVLLRMAELNASTDPRRAALLRRAVAQSKEELIGLQFDRLVELLSKGQLSRAIENQTDLDGDLLALLDLLLSEDRAKQIEDQKRRYREYIKRVNEIIVQQRDVQSRTADGSGAPPKLAEEQDQLAQKTGKLAGDIKKNEEQGQGKAAGDKAADEKRALEPAERDGKEEEAR